LIGPKSATVYQHTRWSSVFCVVMRELLWRQKNCHLSVFVKSFLCQHIK